MMNSITAARRLGPIANSQAYVAVKGLVLSHLVGLCFFLSFAVNRAITFQLGPTRLMEWPIRLLGLWLILDRFGRFRKVKLHVWDWTHLIFAAGYGFALIYAEVYMQRDTGLINYVQWMGSALNGYVFFLVVREGATRKGFNPEIIVRWILWTLAICSVIALLQARDLLGARGLIDRFYHQVQAEAHMEGPSAPWQARGPALHANTMALMLVMGLPLFSILAAVRKLRWWEYGMIALMVFTVFATYSRIGILSLAAVEAAFVAVLFFKRQYYKASVALLATVGLVVAFAAVVMIFDIQRYKVLVTGQSKVQFSAQSDTIGWKLRQQRIERAIDTAEKYPLTGIGAASGALNQERVLVKNEYTFGGLLLNVYVYAFVYYGIVGIAFLLGVFYCLFSQGKHLREKKAIYATACLLVGAALAVAGIAENVLFVDAAMITVNLLMALTVMNAQPQMQKLAVQNPFAKIKA